MTCCKTNMMGSTSKSFAKLLVIVASVLMPLFPRFASAAESTAGRASHVLLVGASIGQDWNLPDLPRRVPIQNYEFEAVQAWQFDKSELIDGALMRPARKFKPTLGYVKGFFKPAPTPVDLFILKECSSYFPSDMQRNRALVQRWIGQIKASRKPIILATTVPVTEKRSMQDPGKQAAVREFNDWLRGYAKSVDVTLLDLEAALRVDDKQRFLRDDLTSGDGSHLNRDAYRILDGVLVSTLCELGKPNAACAAQTALRSQ